MTITLEEITFDNVGEVLNLDLGDIPPAYVETPGQTLAYAYAGTVEGLPGFCRAIAADGETVGLFLIGQAVPGEGDPQAALKAERFFRLMGLVIDAKRRGRGIGRGAMAAILSAFDALYPHTPLVLECHGENAAACHLYRGAGFEDTGLRREGHVVLFRG